MSGLGTESGCARRINALDAHAAAGHDLIPIEGKRAFENGWRRAAALPLHRAKARIASGKNVGVRLRDIDLVVDVDPRHFEAGDDPLARLIRDFALPEAPFVLTGGGGRHLYYRKPSGAAVAGKLTGYAGIDFKSLGGQVVAAGSVHPETGRPYRLDDDALARSLSEAPEATTALLDAIGRRPAAASATACSEIDPEQLALLLSKLPVLDYNGCYDDWIRIMMASHHATGGAGIEEFVAWSVGDPDYADHEVSIKKHWNSFDLKSNCVTAKTLFKALSEAGLERGSTKYYGHRRQRTLPVSPLRFPRQVPLPLS